MSDDTYNGWKNRETWAAQLWLTNDQGVYEMVRERVSDWMERYPHDAIDATTAARRAGEAVYEMVDELTDLSEGLLPVEQIVALLRDVGSLYRVNWDEIGAAWLADFEESGD